MVLAVESDTRAREALKNLLAAEGYNVHAVANSNDARAILEDRVPAVLITEAEGEGQAGYELCVFVKSSQRLHHVPVVMITRSAFPSDYSIAHAMGATICMAKPYKNDRLAHVVRLLAPPPLVKQPSEPPRPSYTLRRKGTAPTAERIRVPKFLKF